MNHLAQILRVNGNLELVSFGEERVGFDQVSGVDALRVAVPQPVERLFEEHVGAILHPVLFYLADSLLPSLDVLRPSRDFVSCTLLLLFFHQLLLPKSCSQRHNLADQVEMLRVVVMSLELPAPEAMPTLNRRILHARLQRCNILWADLVVFALGIHRLSIRSRVQVLEVFAELFGGPLQVLCMLVEFLFGGGGHFSGLLDSLGDDKGHNFV